MSKIVGNYSLTHKLGQGAFAQVYKATRLDTQKEFAVKQIDCSKLSNPRVQDGLESEISIMRGCTHENIVCLFDHFTTTRHVYLVLELCRGGDLHNYIQFHGRLEESVTRRFLLHLESGLQFLSERNLLHRDIKPHNLLLSEFSPRAVLKLADFGMARALAGAALATTLCGSPLYMAPEILRNQDYDAKADLWSVGCVVFQMMVGKPPFHGDCQSSLLRNIERDSLVFPAEIPFSDDMRAVLVLILRPDPRQRGSLKDLSNICRRISASIASPAALRAAAVESPGRPSSSDHVDDGQSGNSTSPRLGGSRTKVKAQSEKVKRSSPNIVEQVDMGDNVDDYGAGNGRSPQLIARRNSDPSPAVLAQDRGDAAGKGVGPGESEAVKQDSKRGPDSAAVPTQRPTFSNSPRTASVRPATATMVMGLGQHQHAHNLGNTAASGQPSLVGKPAISPPNAAKATSPVLGPRPPLPSASPNTAGSPSSPPLLPQALARNTVQKSPKLSPKASSSLANSNFQIPLLPAPVTPLSGSPKDTPGCIIFRFGTTPTQAAELVATNTAARTERLLGDDGEDSHCGSDDDFVIVENTSSHPWRAVNSGCSEQQQLQQQQQQHQHQQQQLQFSGLGTERAIFVAAMAQHCQRIAAIVVAVTVAGDTLARDHLYPPSRESEQVFAAYKERARAARACCPSQSRSPHPLACALAVYLRALLLLKDVMQRTLGLRLSEPDGSQYVEPVDKLLQELAKRFQDLVQRAEQCRRRLGGSVEEADALNTRCPPAEPLLLHAAVQLTSDGTVQQLLGDLMKACDSFQLAKYLVEAVLLTASDSNDRRQLQGLLKQISEKLDSCEKSSAALGYSRQAASMVVPISTSTNACAQQSSMGMDGRQRTLGML